ncbi:thioredoxin-related transmembrane protein 1 [Teleopsis dalmanni]|uniref:thioredoxin-related transmembrane protein 1 n=1 Tax=Teleopsis dalmanni TaxID=139649 RepID=UPI0018CEB037|nr:thioredoxin-related transmembrane protein 1 [Teleopsis dalmanni]XP_037949697.1 thioredoxin-related transmembrane protein 1 [Teleopsis dalmanni]
MIKYFNLHHVPLTCFAFVGILAFLGNAGALGKEQNHIVDLHESNWDRMLNGEWMVEFYAPWCPACKNLAPTWERFAKSAQEINVNVAKIDVTTSPSLSGRFFVTALPTIFHVYNGDFRIYRGSREGDALMLFVKQRQWEKLDTISAWKKPNTIHMSVLSYFFKISHMLKDFNGRLQDEYGLPTWGSYALFAIATIFVGAALGLMLVCVVDLLFPPKKTQRQSFSEVRIREEINEDIANDELEDDDDQDEDDTLEEVEDDDNLDNYNVSTSDGEKFSHSESEEIEIDLDSDEEAKKPPQNKTEGLKEKNSVEVKDDVDKVEEIKEKNIKAKDTVKEENKEKITEPSDTSPTTTNDIRKRKPRKAD